MATDKFVSLVNPERVISDIIVNITNITNDMVKDAPVEKDIVMDLFEFIGDSPIVAHNTPFDIAFLKELAKRHDIGFEASELYSTP